MRIFLCFGLLCLSVSFAFAQDSKVDSLQKIVINYQKDDTTKVILLSQLAEAYLRNYNFASGLLLNEEVLALSEKLAYRKGEGLFLRNKGVFCGLCSRYVEFDYYWQAMQIFEKLRDNQEIAITWSYEANFPDLGKAMDSLVGVLPIFEQKKDKNTQAEILLSMANDMFLQQKYDDAITYGQKALLLFEEVGNTRSMISTQLNNVLAYEKQGQKAKAAQIEVALLNKVDKIKDAKVLSMSLYAIGEFYLRTNRYALATGYLLKCASACKWHDEVLMAYVLFSVGQLYHAQEHFAKATEYYFMVLNISKQKDDPRLDMASYYNYLGFSHNSEKKYAKAMQYHLQAKELAEKKKNRFGVAQSLDGIGQVYLEEGKYKEALASFFESKALFEVFEKKWVSAYMHFYIAKCYQGLGEINTSLTYGLDAYSFASQVNGVEIKIKSTLLIAQDYEQLGKYKQAYEFQSLHLAIKDSILGRDNANRLADIEIQTMTEKSKQAIELLEKDKKIQEEENKNQRLWLFSMTGTLFSVLMFSFVLYANSKNKQKANQKLAEQKEQITLQAKNLSHVNIAKDKLFAIIGHDLRSPINSLTALMSLLEGQNISVNEVVVFSGKLKKGVEHVHFTLNNLLLWANSQMQGLHTNPQMTDLCELVIENFNLLEEMAYAKKINLRNNLSSNSLAWVDTDQINLVFRNLISNAVKFTPSGGSILVSGVQKEKMWEIAITDTGTGISEENLDKLFRKGNHFSTHGTDGEKGIGLGLSLCQEMIDKNNGQIWVESTLGIGTTFRFTLPTKA